MNSDFVACGNFCSGNTKTLAHDIVKLVNMNATRHGKFQVSCKAVVATTAHHPAMSDCLPRFPAAATDQICDCHQVIFCHLHELHNPKAIQPQLGH